MRVLLASTNPGKIAEIERLLLDLPLEFLTLAAFPDLEEPHESGATFEANARLKGRHYARGSGLLTLAEDSGLEIDALGGAPGVHSSRWNGDSYPEKFARIYAELAARGLATSPARFVCHAVAARGDAILFEARGTVEGRIAAEPRGLFGFGYDPIFEYPPFGCTLGEVEPGRKETISHRGAAFRAVRTFLAREAGLSASAPAGPPSRR